MKVEYTKPPKVFSDQVDLMIKRGLHVPNREKAQKVLENISYSRLSAYWHPLIQDPKEKEQFKQGVEFDTIFHIYQFDSDLRMLVFYGIEQIEIAFRTQLIYHLSHQYQSGFWFLESSAFKNYPSYIKLLSSLTKGVAETKQEFIKKYQRNYTQFLPPAWKGFELLSFRSLFTIYKNLSDKNCQAAISKHFGLHHTVFISWMETIAYIRNICAHHARLWNIKLTITPTWPKKPHFDWVDRWENEDSNETTNDKVLKPYAVLCIIQYFLNQVNPYHRFSRDLKSLINKYSECDPAHMGFTKGWENEPLWK